MSTLAYSIPAEPGRFSAFVLAGVVHLILISFLWVGIRWQSETPVTVEAEVWDTTVRQAAPKPVDEPRPEPKPVIKPEPKIEPTPEPVKPPEIVIERKPKVKPEPKPEPKQESKPEPKPVLATAPEQSAVLRHVHAANRESTPRCRSTPQGRGRIDERRHSTNEKNRRANR